MEGDHCLLRNYPWHTYLLGVFESAALRMNPVLEYTGTSRVPLGWQMLVGPWLILPALMATAAPILL